MIMATAPVKTPTTYEEMTALRVDGICRSATVQRFHTENTIHKQSVGEHTYDVMWIVYFITRGGASKNLLLAALMHDTPEYVTGDIPAPVKRANAHIKAACDALEDNWFGAMDITPPRLSRGEVTILKTADVLSGCLFCMNELNRGNKHIHRVLCNFIQYAEQLELTDAALHILDHVKRNTYESK